MARLRLDHVSKTYGKNTVIRSYSADFGTGVHVLTGPSGAGKTTLLKLCATAEPFSDGALFWDDVDITKSPQPFRRTLGYAPQVVAYPEDLTGLEFLTHIGALKGLSPKESEEQGQSLMQRVGLLDARDVRISAYSGGMRRRLGLVQALLGSPTCLILDEPTSELDKDTAAHVNALIFEQANRCVVLMTTHLEDHLADYSYSAHPVV